MATKHPQDMLTAEQVYKLSKCNVMNAALSLDKPSESHISLDKAPIIWSDAQRASLAKAYHELLTSL